MRHERAALFGAALVSVAVLAVGCGSSSGGEGEAAAATPTGVSVVASTNVYGDIAKQIAGDKATITSIISDPAADPHSYEANTRTQLDLSKAEIVIENGGGYDDFVDTMLKSAGSDAKVLNAVDISGKTATGGAELNEHVWYDFPTMSKLADQLVSALSTADPGSAATFSDNATAFKQKLQGMEQQSAAIRSAHSGAGVAITEPVPLYLLEACGLANKTPEEFSEAIEEGTDVPAAVLKETLDLFAGKQVELLAYNEQTSGPETEKVLAAAKDHQVDVVPVTETLPAGKDYLTWMTENLSAIETALR
ncbi:metal ABC transporter substrate-binding protein [Asanoa ishikariensis]|uniref:Zinc/manganese transport system substrate-binding protein n=1 Tax=Asanoa ishikariensis TaxID=137265 RepID=A0A1H3TM73_9ACTN|nr:zinc ABC transporter substrate-binding protein [Asanoa ishikariensis]GIF62142.1 metal ABC transporter substrate-binding protein [Asanoa ishikariensis]SDZ51344.1 zinc/manganese transport system substrate-binding protein [Asanoa ishikariensis]